MRVVLSNSSGVPLYQQIKEQVGTAIVGCAEGNGFELRDVSFELPTGYVMGLIGADGVGKTPLGSYGRRSPGAASASQRGTETGRG